MNYLTRIKCKKEIITKIIPLIVTPFVTKDWWNYIFDFTEYIADNVPCWIMGFDKSGKICDIINKTIG